ncbi:cryptochrome/photolyase family protein, partial [Variovorax sp.]|uniref:cryptochrome/photolyase family protein n=1 Tax=Variovorax sp. TaxID=1871043 RepID=UPI004037F67B
MPPILLAVDKTYPKGLMWFRRDLRVDDNAALYHALRSCRQLVCVFVFDTAILDPLPRVDRRVEFIRESLLELDEELRALGGGLIVRHAAAAEEIPALARALEVQAVFANRDDEPGALARDAGVFGALANAGVSFHTHKDSTVFERDELMTKTGQPYTVFTPYKRAWLAKVDDFFLKSYPSRGHADALVPPPEGYRAPVPSLEALGFAKSNLGTLEIPTGTRGAAILFEDFFERIERYEAARNYPAVRGPSYLGVHLRFGTVSIRRLAAAALLGQQRGSEGAAVWLSELVWRDFYAQILSNFPHAATASFKPEYDAIQWEQGPRAQALFQAWCEGRTGYPLVDAAMAQFNQTGYMHNRLRMVTACFLVKDLGIDWRWGEAYFATHLNDFDLSANNGGWQWASSSGCDAQPYFRIFNPVTQSEKFD